MLFSVHLAVRVFLVSCCPPWFSCACAYPMPPPPPTTDTNQLCRRSVRFASWHPPPLARNWICSRGTSRNSQFRAAAGGGAKMLASPRYDVKLSLERCSPVSCVHVYWVTVGVPLSKPQSSRSAALVASQGRRSTSTSRVDGRLTGEGVDGAVSRFFFT